MMISLASRLSTLARQFSTATPRMSYPSTVQAITISKTGGPEVIEKREIPFPKVAPDHLVIKVESLPNSYTSRNI
jgi:NADPH2:quinone reductase